MSPFKAGVVAIVAAMVCPFLFFGLLALRDWVLHLWETKRRPVPAPEPRVWTEGDRAWSDIHHADWMARRGLLDVQVLWDRQPETLRLAARPHPPG